jgi:hypothetical protein
VTAGSLTEAALRTRMSAKGRPYFHTSIPFHTKAEDGAAGRVAMRSCTRDYKIWPIMKAVRRLARVKRGQKTPVVVQWIGISLDEIIRMKPSREPWCESRWPLIERRMTRLGCLDWLRANGYPEPPRSACVFCPFRSNREWRHLQRNDPEGFAAAVEFDRKARLLRAQSTFTSEPFVHRSLVPLDEVDLRNDTDKGQMTMWADECEGMCGV